MNNDVVILSAVRTPIGRFRGAYKNMSAPELGAIAVRAAVERSGVDPTLFDQCIMGNVISAGLGQAPARQAALRGGLPEHVGGLTINKVCGSGLMAVELARALIRIGDDEFIVAGGMESMTGAPYLLKHGRSGYHMGHGELLDAVFYDGLWCTFEEKMMASLGDDIARARQISRADQDAFALESHRRAIAAQDLGYFAEEIVPVELPVERGTRIIISADETPRRDTSLEALSRLRPVFAEDGTVTAGNAPGLSDGASALVVASGARAEALGLKPLARILGFGQAADPPADLFAAPELAIRQLLEHTNTRLSDYKLFEINEAFAAQVLANVRTLGIDHANLNIDGGAIALGHPIGASGARVLTSLIYSLRRRGGGRGIAALCLGGGEAVAMAVEC